MLTKFRSVLVVLSLLLPSAVLADGLIFQLPPDGTWARFEFDGTAENRDGKVNSRKGTMTISSVGIAQVEGEACRWIELAGECKHEGNREILVHKLLIPEKSLGKGENPLARVHKAWQQQTHFGNVVLREISDVQREGSRATNSLLPFLHGPHKGTEPLAKEVVESKLGKLECEGLQAQLKTERPENRVFDWTNIIRLHPSAPFGVVTHEYTRNVREDGKVVSQMTQKMKLVDFGKDAKSQLPDSK